MRLVGAESENAYIAAIDSAFAGCVNSDRRVRSQWLNSFDAVIVGGRRAIKINIPAATPATTEEQVIAARDRPSL